MKKTLLILAFALGLTQITQAQNSYPIDGKWTYEASLNTMYIFLLEILIYIPSL